MKISEKMVKRLSEQVNMEWYSAYLYYQMALDADAAGLPGMSYWLKQQTKEEIEHGERIMEYVMERRDHCTLDAIDKPEFKWESPLKTMQAALEHEELVTASIHKLVEEAREEKDWATVSMLQWFVDEQVEEEDTCETWIDAFEGAGDNAAAIYMVDRGMGKREEE